MSGVTGAASREDAAPASSESGLFVYGVMDSGDSVPDGLTGLDAEPVTALASGRVAAIVTRVSIERPPGRGAELLAYNGVLDAVAQGPTVVAPVRFGSVLADEQAVVEDFLAPDEEYFAELLASLRGRDQYMFQAVYDEQQILSEVVAAEPEIAELRRYTSGLPQDAAYGERVRLGELVAAAVEGRRSMDAEWLLDQVLPLSEAHSLRAVSGLERVVDVALLVESERREDFEARLETLAEEVHGRLRLRLMGPTAPYDFTGGI